MDYKLELQNNNIDLSAILDTINVLPDKVTLDTEIIAQEEKLSTQDALIAGMMTALEGKASGNNVKTTKTIHLDWSQDEEMVRNLQYISNNEIVTVWCYDNIETIEAEGGIIYSTDGWGTYYSQGFIHFSENIHVAMQDGETIYFVSSGIMDN